MDQPKVICAVRRRKIILTPEEEVRQGIIHYLNETLGYPIGLMSVEAEVKVNGMSKRADIIIHDEHGNSLMVVECKRRGVALDEKTVGQIAMYNHSLDAPYLMLSNGDEVHMFFIDREKKNLNILKTIPRYSEL